MDVFLPRCPSNSSTFFSLYWLYRRWISDQMSCSPVVYLGVSGGIVGVVITLGQKQPKYTTLSYMREMGFSELQWVTPCTMSHAVEHLHLPLSFIKYFSLFHFKDDKIWQNEYTLYIYGSYNPQSSKLELQDFRIYYWNLMFVCSLEGLLVGWLIVR